MWCPRTEAEIQTGIENGIVRETTTFDAKRALPAAGKNKDLAKDICAMTVDGGVLLYGLGGKDPTRPNKREPFGLTGAAERIDQVAQTAIAEPPVVEIYDISSEEHPGKGYLCIVIPASPRAPHMLTIDHDNRYWGRGATGNRLLTEGEVARLYERRERWESDHDQMLDETIASMPFAFGTGQHGVVVAVLKQVVPGRELLRQAAAGEAIDEFLQRELPAMGRRADIYDQGTFGLGDAFEISRGGAELWICSHDRDLSAEYQARAELTADGGLTYWHSPLFFTIKGSHQVIAEKSVTRAVYQALAAARWLYDKAAFHGNADVGIGVLGIQTAIGGTRIRDFSPTAYGAPDYRNHERVTGEELQANIDDLTRRLLAPPFEVISVRGYDPLADAGRR